MFFKKRRNIKGMRRWRNEMCTYNLTYRPEKENYVVIGIEIIGSPKEIHVELPHKHKGHIVVGIEDRAFAGKEQIVDVTLNGDILYIGEEAFSGCVNLKEISFFGSIGTIKKSAFYDCKALEKVYISDIVNWCKIVFEDKSANPLWTVENADLYLNGELVKELKIPEDVVSVCNYAFCGCGSITKITIKDISTKIGISAFDRCLTLKDITIMNSVVTMGSHAFCCCKSLENLIISNSTTLLGEYAFCQCTALEHAIFSNSTVTIPNHAFYSCTSLAEIIIPNSVTSIGQYAFYYCISLINITIPQNVQYIGYHAFYSCDKLIEVRNLSPLNIIARSEDHGWVAYYADNVYSDKTGFTGLFETKDGYICYDRGGKILLMGFTDKITETQLILPKTINGNTYGIYDYAICGNKTITKVTVPDTVISVGQRACIACKGLCSVCYEGDEASWNRATNNKGIYLPSKADIQYKKNKV